MPSRRHQLQQLTAARRRQQQQLQTNADLGKFPSVFPRPYGGRHSRRPIRHDTNGERNETNHGSRGAAMIRLGRWEFMVAVVDGRRRRRPVYVRYFSYYSYRRHMTYLFFWWSAVEKTGSRQNHFTRFLLTLLLKINRSQQITARFHLNHSLPHLFLPTPQLPRVHFHMFH